MIENKFYDLDDKLYYKKLDNGLNVYIIPNNNVSNFYLSLFTKYGSNDLKFKKDNEKEYHNIHPGTAHFLEHLMFHKENKVNILDEFEKLQISSNAYTSNDITCFVAYGNNNYDDALRLLINYVYHPYFPEENIERERGVILSEAKGYIDDPYRALHDELNESVYNKLHYKIKVEGSLDDIKNINSDDINSAYNTFYHPSNMTLLITGNVNIDSTMNIINDVFSKLSFSKPFKINREVIDEDENVNRKNYSTKGLVSSPSVRIIIKNKLDRFSNLNITKKELDYYIKIITACNFGDTSEFKYKLDDEYKISVNHGGYTSLQNNIINITLYGKITNNNQEQLDKFINICKEHINNLNVTKEDFNRKKKIFIANFINIFDRVDTLNYKFTNDIINYDEISTNEIKLINNLDYDKCLEVIKLININNQAIVTMLPNGK